ncbi:hypothetical protein K501DRAFT_283426 [Backusella circina FSU 941]|nr:hypothetical protein K501DRAFT_283426 [Backusella circina FSU 941]
METSVQNVRKRSLSPDAENRDDKKKKMCTENDKLFNQLTAILDQIKSTPSTGEISAELLSSLRVLLLQIESLSADETNEEAKNMRSETDRYLDVWLQELVQQCEADGEWDFSAHSESNAADDESDDDDDDDEQESLALALALQDEEDYCQDIPEEEKCSKEECEEDIEVVVV